LFVNTRVLLAPLTGVQRYVREVLAAWPGEAPVRLSPPDFAARGIPAHLWEQLLLPRRLGKQLLWSPVHSGPVSVRRQVVTVHDVVPLDHPEWLNPRFARWYRWMMPRLVQRACHVIAVSGFTRDRLVTTTGVDASKISVVPSGISERFRPDPGPDDAEMRRTLGLGDWPYLLSLGSREPRKNLATLLEAWRRAVPRLPSDLHLVIAGAAGRSQVFGDEPSRALPDRVVSAGRIEDHWLPALYRQAEGFVYLSLYEGFGLPPLEAMACGTPALVSDIEVFREVAGDAALRADPRDADAVAQSLVSMSDPEFRDEHARRGPVQARRYCWNETARATREVLARFE